MLLTDERAISLGNGKVLINFDLKGEIIDLYYPHVGMENHTNGKTQRILIFSNGEEIDFAGGNCESRYERNTFVVFTECKDKRVTLTTHSYLELDQPTLFRVFKIENKSEKEQKISLFFLNDFDLYGNPIGDTSFYDPKTFSIIHYKSRRYVGMKVMSPISPQFFSFAMGKSDIENMVKKEEVFSYPIAQGDVESIIQVRIELSPSGSSRFYHVLTLAEDLSAIRSRLKNIDITLMEGELGMAYLFWQSWMKRAKKVIESLKNEYEISLLVLRSHLGDNGSIIASSDYSFAHLYGDTYNYIWPRDAAYASYALDVAGYSDLSLRYLNFISGMATDEGYLFQKYNPDMTLASSWHPWVFSGKEILPIQEDETALTVWAIGKHYELYKDLDELVKIYKRFTKPAIRFIMNYMEEGLPKPSFDLWEERFGVHTYTVATIYGALTTASRLVNDMGDDILAKDMLTVAEEVKSETMKRMVSDGRMIRRLDENLVPDKTIDSSVYASIFFGMFDPFDKVSQATMNAVKSLLSSGGGIARYENDPYRRTSDKPNPWIICTLWMAEYNSMLGNVSGALSLINWVIERANPAGLLPEQVDPYTYKSSSVIPLVWSHAEFVIASHLI
ncbi:glucan 1,3-alpha-glucosidase [Sulfolobales archaeon HS-7]|nr:glucan 1,3-alpha-glucosidase [Sulfolobales archaeon HS-7]